MFKLDGQVSIFGDSTAVPFSGSSAAVEVPGPEVIPFPVASAGSDSRTGGAGGETGRIIAFPGVHLGADPAVPGRRSNDGKTLKRWEHSMATGTASQNGYVANYTPKGGEQTTDPVKNPEDLVRMGQWLLENRGKKYFLAFVIQLNWGLRANELVELKVGDLCSPDGSLKYEPDSLTGVSDRILKYQSKTGKLRRLYINADIAAAVDLCLTPEQRTCPGLWLFPSREGGHLTVHSWYAAVKAAAKGAGVRGRIATHSLRKTFGYRMYQSCRDDLERQDCLTFLQYMFDHGSALTTLRYIGVMDEDVRHMYRANDMGVTEAVLAER